MGRKFQAQGLLTALVLAAVATTAKPAWAQTMAGPGQPAVEVAMTLVVARPPVTVVACCELRTPPHFEITDDAFAALAVGGQVRLRWARRFSTTVEVGWAPPVRRTYAFPAPSSPPPPIAPGFPSTAVVGRGTERRGWTLAAGQGLDVFARTRVRLTLSAGVLLDHLEERYEQASLVYADPQRDSVYSGTRRETRAAGTVTAGMVAYVTRRMFVSADVGIRRDFQHAALSRAGASGKLGIGFGFNSR